MPARKNRPVLYEVYRRPTRSRDPIVKPRPIRPAPETPRPVADDARAPDSGGAFVTRLGQASTTAGHWRISVSGPTLAVLAAAMLVLLLVVFSAGRSYEAAHPSAAAEPQFTEGLGAEPDSGLPDEASPAGPVAGRHASSADQPGHESPPVPRGAEQKGAAAAEQNAESPSARPLRVTLQKGRHYVVIQHFPKSSGRQAALDAAQYLQSNGVECAILPDVDIRLVAVEPFLIDQRDAAAARRERQRADALIQRIKRLGEQYSHKLASEGKPSYSFDGCTLHSF